jgi:hypothetical protein
MEEVLYELCYGGEGSAERVNTAVRCRASMGKRASGMLVLVVT